MLVSLLLPWSIRRRFLESQFGYSLHPTSRIGFCWIFPRRLIMEENSRIGHLTVCKNIDLLHLGAHAIIGQLNWITGFPTGPSRHFAHQPDRRPELIVETHAGISSRHLIDCTARVRIGAFATVGGFRSQLITHSIDLAGWPAIGRAHRHWRILLCRDELCPAGRKQSCRITPCSAPNRSSTRNGTNLIGFTAAFRRNR